VALGLDPQLMGPGTPGRRAGVAAAVVRARVLFSSYAPFFGILALRLDPPAARIACLGLVIVGIGDAIRLTWLAPKGFSRPTVQAVRDAGGEVAAYLATYLLPLLAAPNPDGWDLGAYAVYFGLVIVITLRSNLAHVNPMLYLLGWRVVTVTLEGDEDHERYLVCRRAPIPGERVQVAEMVGVLHASS
jgi:hypothetical protein